MPDVTPTEARKLRYQRKLPRQVKYSNRWNRTKLILQRINKKFYNIYQNWRHHITNKLSGLYNVIVLENLTIQKMTAKDRSDNRLSKVMSKKKLRTMNKNILDTAWYKLEELLKYKCGSIEKVPPRYTSQTCSSCSYINEDNRQGNKFKCLNCGFKVNSDLNASFNIFDIYYVNKLRTSGNGVTRQGDATIDRSTMSVNCQIKLSVLQH